MYAIAEAERARYQYYLPGLRELMAKNPQSIVLRSYELPSH